MRYRLPLTTSQVALSIPQDQAIDQDEHFIRLSVRGHIWLFACRPRRRSGVRFGNHSTPAAPRRGRVRADDRRNRDDRCCTSRGRSGTAPCRADRNLCCRYGGCPPHCSRAPDDVRRISPRKHPHTGCGSHACFRPHRNRSDSCCARLIGPARWKVRRRSRGSVVSDQKLPFSNRSHTRIVDDLGEQTVRVTYLCERLQVDGLIRLHRRDYELVEILHEKYVHFNLEFTLNERGKRYAMLPILRSGYRTESDDAEVLPVLDPRRHRIGVCEAVMQRVPIEEVSSAHFAYSIETVMTIDELRTALIQRYTPLFPNLRPEQLLSRGCAITLISFQRCLVNPPNGGISA
jgi:hypothetical protein